MSDLTHSPRLSPGIERPAFDWRLLTTGIVVAALMALPMASGSFLLYSLALCFANGIAVLSVSMLIRYGGEVSIGHSFFVALGAYTVAILEKQLGVSILVGLPVAAVLGFLAGILFAFPTRRMSGIYLAVATMALALALPELLVHAEKWTGGFEGLYVAADLLPGVSKTLQRYYFTLLCLGLVCLALRHFRGSRQGLALLLARAHPRAAEAFGITRSWARVSIFAISATLASLSGALMAFASSTVSPNSFTLWSAIFFLVGAVVSLEGISLLAALVGGAFIVMVPHFLAGAGDYVLVLYGTALLAVTLLANSRDQIRKLLASRGKTDD